MRHKLTQHVERALADLQASRIAISTRFGGALQDVATASKQPVMCSTGCSHCCYYPVMVSVLEGVLVYRHLTRRGTWVPALRQKLQAHADQTFGLAYEVWLLSMSPCPMLDANNRCSIYPVRPLICRLTLSTGDPHYCHPHRLGGNTHIVPRVSASDEFYALEQRHFLVNGAHHVLLPLSKAILMAERLLSGELAFEKLDRAIGQELEDRL